MFPGSPKSHSTLAWALFQLLIICASISAFAPSVMAASSTRILTKNGTAVLISAGTMFGDSEKQTVELVGDVQLTFDGQSLRADRATIDKKNGTILAEGNVVLASANAYVEGSRIEISYEDNKGIIYDGFVKSGQVIFQGKIIRKIGIDQYEAEKASYTACTTCPPAWSFSGSRIDAEIGAYAFIKSATFYLGGLPFFWFPVLIVPLKSERQSGVLFPLYEIDTEGDKLNINIGIPLFWAISRSQDLTFTPKFDSKRGWRGLVNYRYVLNEESQGDLNFGGLLKDKLFSNDKTLPSLPGDERSGRWFVSYNHIYALPGNFVNRAKLNLVSDLRYTRNFPEEILGVGDSALENRLSLSKNTELMHSSVEVAYYVNQLKANPLEGNADAVHRFPEFKQSGVDRSLWGSRIFLRWDFNYVNFAREDIAFDDVQGTGTGKTVNRTRGGNTPGVGTFDPNDLDVIRTGQRLDLRPELSAPFRIGKYLDVLPSLQLRNTHYSFNVTPPSGTAFDPVPTRQYLRGRLALRTQLYRLYHETAEEPLTADGEVLGAQTRMPALAAAPDETTGIFQALQDPIPVHRPAVYKHEIEPEISVSGIPWLQQTDSPFFGQNASTPIFMDSQPVSNSDFFSAKGLQFDYEDRITQRNITSILITNRLIRKTWVDDEPSYRQTVSIKNGTSYEFDKPDQETNSNFSDIFTIIDTRFENFSSNTSVRYFPLHRVFNTSTVGRVFDITGNFIQASFSQNYLITENVREAFSVTSPEENIGFAFGAVNRFATIVADLNFRPVNYSPAELDLSLKSWAAELRVRPPGDCWGFRLGITRVLTEDSPRYQFGFDYNFGGST